MSPRVAASGLSPGAIIGIAVAAVLTLVLLILLAYVLCFRRRAPGKGTCRALHYVSTRGCQYNAVINRLENPLF